MKGFILILVLFAFSCGRKPSVYSEEQVTADIIYCHDSYKPFSGTCVVYFTNTDKIKEEFTVKKGRLNGKAQMWYRNGKLCRKGFYSNGHITGKWMFYNQEGNLITEATYKNDSLNGAYLSLYANGDIREKGYYKTGRKSGEWHYGSEP